MDCSNNIIPNRQFFNSSDLALDEDLKKQIEESLDTPCPMFGELCEKAHLIRDFDIKRSAFFLIQDRMSFLLNNCVEKGIDINDIATLQRIPDCFRNGFAIERMVRTLAAIARTSGQEFANDYLNVAEDIRKLLPMESSSSPDMYESLGVLIEGVPIYNQIQKSLNKPCPKFGKLCEKAHKIRDFDTKRSAFFLIQLRMSFHLNNCVEDGIDINDITTLKRIPMCFRNGFAIERMVRTLAAIARTSGQEFANDYLNVAEDIRKLLPMESSSSPDMYESLGVLIEGVPIYNQIQKSLNKPCPKFGKLCEKAHKIRDFDTKRSAFFLIQLRMSFLLNNRVEKGIDKNDIATLKRIPMCFRNGFAIERMIGKLVTIAQLNGQEFANGYLIVAEDIRKLLPMETSSSPDMYESLGVLIEGVRNHNGRIPPHAVMSSEESDNEVQQKSDDSVQLDEYYQSPSPDDGNDRPIWDPNRYLKLNPEEIN